MRRRARWDLCAGLPRVLDSFDPGGVGNGNGGARFLVGPAVARSSSRLVGATQARLDLAKPISSHFALLASGRFVYIPKFRGDSFSLGSIGVGFRLR